MARSGGNRALAWGRLLRVSLWPSAVADAAVGLLLAHAGQWPPPARGLWLLGAALCAFAGGLALNDWTDCGQDRREGRPRPLARGELSSDSALAAALGLFALALLAARLASPWCVPWIAALIATAAAYDLAWRGAWRGPGLLAVCRAANLGAPLVWGAAVGLRPVPGAWSACLAYGLFVFFAARVARWEDAESTREPGRSPALALLGSALCLPLVPASVMLAGEGLPSAYAWAALALALAAAWPLFRGAVRELGASPPASGQQTRQWAGAWAGRALRRLLIATGSTALAGAGAASGIWLGLAVLCGFPLSWRLRKLFPPT